MTLLVICPDYASHLLPLLTLATAWRDAGERVVVATGPATYVEDGVTGRLTATWDVGLLREAIGLALDQAELERDAARPDRSRAMVQQNFTIQRMSSALGVVYRGVARDEAALAALAEPVR